MKPTRIHALAATALIAVMFLVGSCAHRERVSSSGPPPSLRATEVHSDHGMVSTSSVEATRAGVQILEQGGNAVDAAVATAFALGVAAPGGSGLGGMTYVLISPAHGPSIAIDGSATVPLAADPETLLELRISGEWAGARAVAVPMTVAALHHALRRFGTMSLREVLQPSIEVADRGFRLNADTLAWTSGYLKEILASHYLRFIVLENGERLASEGDVICRPDLAATLRRIAERGPEEFYRGAIARQMLADLGSRGGYVQRADLLQARARELPPIQTRYRGADIITYPWPGGGDEVAEALNILDHFPSEFLARHSVERLHVLIEAFRMAHTDHMMMGFRTTGNSLGTATHLTERHARERAALITPGRAIPESALGTSEPIPAMGEHTTHVSVVDRHGNAVALSQTLCRQYGAKVATPGLGFPYNSCLEFFDYEHPDSPYFLRPRARYVTFMAPTVVRRDGELFILGSAGSDRIPPSVVGVISNLLDRDMNLLDAVIAPRVLWNSAHDPPRICIEITPPNSGRDADRLQSFGFEHIFRLEFPPQPRADLAFFGGVNAVRYDLDTGVFSGVGDPRRSGFALGPRAVVEYEEHP